MDIEKKISPALAKSGISARRKGWIKKFPDAPGVYMMKDQRGKVLYVGKAAALRKRVGSYFQRPPTAKTEDLLQKVSDIDFIQTASSAQALLLENSLIKEHRPYYNASLKDDKSYPFVKISTAGGHPYLSIVRGKKEKQARYYGPYTNVRLLKSAIKALRAIFPFCSCKRLPKKPCLYYQLRLCPGPCLRQIEQQTALENLRQLELFLQGRQRQLLKQLREMMQQAAKNELFERAAGLRDRISALGEIVIQTRETGRQELLLELQKLLQLPRAPQRIEAFDISEIAGSGTVGAMVSFVGGWPDKNNYRRFKIKAVQGNDDYAMMREVLRRRYGRLKEERTLTFPDLVMIDGGRGHLSSAQAVLRSLRLGRLPVVALAKRSETIYLPNGKSLNLPREAEVLHLLQRIRNEAHRFAVSYHRNLRKKGMRLSALDKISGIGLKRKQDLLRHFPSPEAIKQASVADLLKVKNINKKIAQKIIEYFRKFETNSKS